MKNYVLFFMLYGSSDFNTAIVQAENEENAKEILKDNICSGVFVHEVFDTEEEVLIHLTSSRKLERPIFIYNKKGE